jgi:hypothetical protein
MENLGNQAVKCQTLKTVNNTINIKSLWKLKTLETLDFTLRGLISKGIEQALNQKNIIDRIRWAVEVYVIQFGGKTRLEDFTLGYVLGSLVNDAIDTVYWTKWAKKVDAQRERSYIKILDREKYNELKAKYSKGKSGRPIKVKVTESEINTIKKIIEPIVEQFRNKISLEWTEFLFSKNKGEQTNK